jgi:hypothetical protein
MIEAKNGTLESTHYQAVSTTHTRTIVVLADQEVDDDILGIFVKPVISSPFLKPSHYLLYTDPIPATPSRPPSESPPSHIPGQAL